MAKQISKDTPLAEITLRRYEKPDSIEGRELIRKLCLSVGLLQPGDSRDVVIDVLHILLKERKELSSEIIKDKVVEYRKNNQLPLKGIASSNIRRQLKRLRELYIIEKVANNYRVTEMANLADTFKDKVEGFLLPSIVSRVKDYIHAIDERFRDE